MPGGERELSIAYLKMLLHFPVTDKPSPVATVALSSDGTRGERNFRSSRARTVVRACVVVGASCIATS